MSPAWDVIPYYTVVMEEFDAQTINDWAATLDALDHRPRELNVEYASKRDSSRIGPMRLTLAPNGTLAPINSVRLHNGQYKQVYLKTEMDYHRRYQQIGQICSAGAASRGTTQSVSIR